MEEFVVEYTKGDVVVLPFPFSDLSSAKRRPALIVTKSIGKDIILAQITSQKTNNKFNIELNESEFENGSLPQKSYIKVNRLFSADIRIIIKKAGKIKHKKKEEVKNKIIELFNN